METINPVNHAHHINAVLIFAELGGRSLIDEVHEDPNNLFQPTATAGAAEILAAGIGTGAALTLTNFNGSPVAVAQVQFVVAMLEMDMGATTVSVGPNAAGVYDATVPFAMPGTWGVNV
jgi:hypothetical protein